MATNLGINVQESGIFKMKEQAGLAKTPRVNHKVSTINC